MPATLLAALALLAWGCAASAPSSSSSAAPAVRADTLVAGVAVVREPGGGVSVFVTVEGRVGEEPLRLTTPAGSFEAAFVGGEVVDLAADEPTRMIVEFRMSEAGIRAMDAAGARALFYVHDGTAYRPYRIRRTDNLE